MHPTPPPMLTHYLLESPWPVMVGLMLVAFALLLLARARANARLLRAALAPVALALVVYLIARFVHTPREQLIDQTRRMVALTAPTNTAALRDLFLPEAAVVTPHGELWISQTQMFSRLAAWEKLKMLQSQRISLVTAEVRAEGSGVSLLRLITTAQTPEGEFTVPSSWLITWKRDAAGLWRIAELRCETIALAAGDVVP